MRRVSLLALMLIGLSSGSVAIWRVAAQTAPAAVPSAQWQQTTVDEWNNGTLDGVIVSNNDDGEIRLDQNAAQGSYTSSGFEAPFIFSAAAVRWNADLPATTALTLELRTSIDSVEWRDWRAVPLTGRAISGTLQLLGPFGVEPESRWLQYRISFATAAQPAVPVVREATWRVYDAAQGPTLLDQPTRTPAYVARATATRPPLVVPRSGWGATVVAPTLQFDRPRRLQITALPLAPDADPPTLIRALQQAARDEGAADLPYTYLVDSAGNVYQGRSGTPSNNGIVELALLGDLTDAARVALAQTLAWLAQAYDLPLSLNVNGALSPEQAEAIRLTAEAAIVRARWTFVESNTRDYNERLMFFNPTSQPASTVITFLPGQANAIQRELTVQPGQRVDFVLNDVFSDTADLPLEVASNQPIIAERTMLFQNDALNEPGIDGWARTWYFAEGNNDPGYDTTIWLYNPQPSEVAVDVLFIPSNGLTQTQALVLPAFQRVAVQANGDVQGTYGVRVAATAPIAAERTMKFGIALSGGFLTRGATAPAKTWYFAEGATIEPFSTTLALMNPGPVAAAITTTLLTDQGTTLTRRFQIPPLSRLTVDVADVLPEPQGFGTIVSASQPIIAERTSYFNNGNAGTNTLGASELAYTWRFAEGRTADPATEFIVLANPNSKPAAVTLRIGKEDGTTQTLQYTVPRTGRIAVLLDLELPFEQAHTTTVESTLPIVAERTILIDNEAGQGGHTSLGVPGR